MTVLKRSVSGAILTEPMRIFSAAPVESRPFKIPGFRRLHTEIDTSGVKFQIVELKRLEPETLSGGAFEFRQIRKRETERGIRQLEFLFC